MIFFSVTSVGAGQSVSAPATDPAQTGLNFDGWYTAATGGVKVAFPYTPDGDVVLYARFVAGNTLTLTGPDPETWWVGGTLDIQVGQSIYVLSDINPDLEITGIPTGTTVVFTYHPDTYAMHDINMWFSDGDYHRFNWENEGLSGTDGCIFSKVLTASVSADYEFSAND